MKNKWRLFLYGLSFFEGGLMLFTELASSRKIAVFFGGSLYVWLIVLCITLLGLAVGYLWASKNIATKEKDIVILSRLFLVLSISLMIWRFNDNIASWLIHYDFELVSSVMIDATVLLFVPMFIYGAITTFIVSILQQGTHSSSVYARVLAISTIGSIVFGILSVILFFPYIGIIRSIEIFAATCIVIGILLYKANFSFIALFVLCFVIPSKKFRGRVLYQNDGVFSSVIVLEDNTTRYLMVNYIIQSFIDIRQSKTMRYVELIDSIAHVQNWKGKKVLILGLGGGMVANKLSKYTSDITGVEIDPRIIDCAKKYFNLSKSVNSICADAQWFVHKDTNKYDVIIMDLFNGEEPPAYLLTVENFQRIKKLLANKNSILIVNWYGYHSGNLGKGTRVLANTLRSVGFYSAYISTTSDESRGNMIIYSSLDKFVLPESNTHIIPDNSSNTADKNVLSLLNANVNYQWRKGYLEFIRFFWQ